MDDCFEEKSNVDSDAISDTHPDGSRDSDKDNDSNKELDIVSENILEWNPEEDSKVESALFENVSDEDSRTKEDSEPKDLSTEVADSDSKD